MITMYKELKAQNKLPLTLLLLGMSILCFLLSLLRCAYSDNIAYLFLNWNLFLAFVPWAFSTFLLVKPNLHQNKFLVFTLLSCWLLFFPNAPYILTDLYHLHSRASAPVWFDLVLILAFAWTGLLFGFTSLFDIEGLLQKFMNKKWIPVLSVFLLFVGSFGIYLGRFQRWNSWDVLNEPRTLVMSIVDRFTDPHAHPRTWGVTIFMGVLLNMIYWSFRFIRNSSAK